VVPPGSFTSDRTAGESPPDVRLKPFRRKIHWITLPAQP
jgi:hypothetical protein